MGTLIKIPDTSGLVTTTVLNTKIGEVENKIPVVRGLVKKTDYDAKIKDIKKKCFTIFDHKKFTIETLDAKIKQKELVNKSEISSLIENSYLNTEFATLSTKVELKGDEDKIMKVKVQEFDSQNRFVYQATLDTSGLKIGKSTDFVLSWISNEIHTSKINPLYTTFLHRIKLSGYRV